ncbi:DNA alkylation repair protein [Undibacterium sp. LX40W]|uniref:DNA alkylation repair protein n=1 Tax=Undibacterium nitidum TaxID=2762298 RepID=A0A923HQ54_9BURK|nr:MULTISPECIES: DNA alkylation repair protein [Undibacterium]MBC3881991.1 DNA alkylation repair protein [Undibacterium nitidum]MBC3892013.1 DNA alkylation repair protein [Undibacterium sp. LX40W]
MQAPDYFEQIQQSLIAHARPENMAGMEAYMLHQFSFLGIKTPERRALIKSLGQPMFTAEQVLQLAEALWGLRYREYHYVAIDTLARHRKVLQVEHVPQLLHLAQQRSWWDSVDGLNAVIGDILLPAKKRGQAAHDLMDQALQHDVMWVRRMVMTHQLGWRLDTDARRLATYAKSLAKEDDFFIRKAIGWAFRDYGRWNPTFVREFFTEYEKEFAKLSVREALKHLT